MIIIMRFGENVLGPKYIDIYQFRGLAGERYMVHQNFLFLFTKTGKIQEHDIY